MTWIWKSLSALKNLEAVRKVQSCQSQNNSLIIHLFSHCIGRLNLFKTNIFFFKWTVTLWKSYTIYNNNFERINSVAAATSEFLLVSVLMWCLLHTSAIQYVYMHIYAYLSFHVTKYFLQCRYCMCLSMEPVFRSREPQQTWRVEEWHQLKREN